MSVEKQKNEIKFCNLANDIISKAKKMGASCVEVDAGISSGFSLNVRKNEVETIEHSNGKNLGVTVYFGYRTGSATTSDLSSQAINAMLEKACYIARFTSEDPFVGLADKTLMAYDYKELDLDLYHPWRIKVEAAINLAKSAESTGFSYDKRLINSEGSSLNTFEAFDIYANSHGFCGTMASTKHGFSCSFIAEDKGEMQRDYYYTTARNARDLENADQVAICAAKRTIDRLNAQRITTRSCPVVFISEIASSLIGNFIRAIYGSSIYKKSSFLLDQLNKQVLAKHINIEENPHIPKALGSAAFDCEGVKISKSSIVVDGILQRYILDSYAARKLKMKTTGNAGGVHNLIVKSSNLDLDLNGLLGQMGTGLLVTELMGDGVNIVTGDYSRGVFGYWVENGKIQYPVTGITIAGNLKNMLLGVVAVGNDIDHRGNILTGSILLDNIIIAGS